MLERTIENKLRTAVKQAGGIALKFTSPGLAGVPDRLIILPPGGKYAFIEVKRPSQKPRPLQKARHAQLKKLGCHVYVLDNPDNITDILNEIQTT